MDAMKELMAEAMVKSEAIGRRAGLAEAADLALKAYSVSTREAQIAVHRVFSGIMDLMHKATPEEVHAQRVEGASGGDPDPS